MSIGVAVPPTLKIDFLREKAEAKPIVIRRIGFLLPTKDSCCVIPPGVHRNTAADETESMTVKLVSQGFKRLQCPVGTSIAENQ
jgi:hypothetical protein